MPILDDPNPDRELEKINTKISSLLKRLNHLMPEADRVRLAQHLFDLTRCRMTLSETERSLSRDPSAVPTASCIQARRVEQEHDVEHTANELELEPTRYEQQLMTLLQFQTLLELEDFLNGPSHPKFLEQSEVPEEDYELLEREREEEERVYQQQVKQRTVNVPHTQRVHDSRAPGGVQPQWWMPVISTVFVIGGLFPLPYGYYMLLRLVLCIVAANGFFKALDRRMRSWVWVYGILAVVYNPIFPLRIGNKSVWELINFLTLAFFWVGIAKLASPRPTNCNSQNN